MWCKEYPHAVLIFFCLFWAADHSQICSCRTNEQIIDSMSAHQKLGMQPSCVII